MALKKEQNQRKGPKPGGAEKMMKTFKKICKRFEEPPPRNLLAVFKKGIKSKTR